MDLIVAVSSNWGIGYKGDLLFSIPDDMKYFRETTKDSVVIMGRTTLDSFPGQNPLKNRVNVVLTNNTGLKKDGVIYINNVSEIGSILKENGDKKVFVIGGESIYKLLLPYCKNAYVTRIDSVTTADRFLPDLDALPNWSLYDNGEALSYNGLTFRFTKYVNNSVLQLD